MSEKCPGCGVEKDPDALEVYPFPEDDYFDAGPMEPLLSVSTDRVVDGKTVRVLVCHQCFHRLDPDMWISRRCWDSLNPVVEYDKL